MHCVVARLFTSCSIVGVKKLRQFNPSKATFIRLNISDLQRRYFSDLPSKDQSESLGHTKDQSESLDHSKDQLESLDNNVHEADEFDFESTGDDTEEVDFEKIAGGDPELIKYLKITQLELEMLRQNGYKTPTRLSAENWSRLLFMRDSKTQRIRYVEYLWLNETKKRHRKERQALAFKIFEEKKRDAAEKEPVKLSTSSPLIYGLQYVTLFHRVYDTQINRHYNYNLLLASWFNPHIIFDCGYEPYMSEKDLSNTIKQILLAWSENREHLNPSHLFLCNLNPDGEMRRRIRKLFPTMDEPDYPLFTTEKSYLDFYPKEKLVYLTPHCTEVLTEYNPEDVYIIGAIVDQSKSEPLSLAKAKKEGIRKAKFPIDQCVHWGTGTKSLTLNHSLAIMNDVKNGCSWTNAFIRHLPKRKVLGSKITNRVTDEKQDNYYSTRSIREQYRRNLVYDLLMQQRGDKTRQKEKESEKNDISPDKISSSS